MHRHQHVILHLIAKFRSNQTIVFGVNGGGNLSACQISMKFRKFK